MDNYRIKIDAYIDSDTEEAAIVELVAHLLGTINMSTDELSYRTLVFERPELVDSVVVSQVEVD